MIGSYPICDFCVIPDMELYYKYYLFVNNMKIIILTLVLFAFCHIGGEKVLELTTIDNNRETQINVGEKVKLVLIAQGGTGYEWHSENLDTNILRLIDKKSVYEGGRSKVGGEMVHTWLFEALKPGDTELRMMYYRRWEGKSNALKSFNVKLHVMQNLENNP